MTLRSNAQPIGKEGERALSKATMSIAGVGGVGSIIADALVRDDIQVRIIDKGRVEEADVPRQTLYTAEDLTRFKAKQAKKRLEAINPQTKVKAFHEQILPNNVYLLKADVVFDCTQDNASTALIAEQCKKDKSPLIIVRSYGTAYSVIVSTKAVPAKLISSLKEPDYEKEGILGATTREAAAVALVEAYKIILKATKGTYAVEGDVWKGTKKKTTL